MVVAVERFTADHPDHKGQIAFLITSDEEGPAHGTRRWSSACASAASAWTGASSANPRAPAGGRRGEERPPRLAGRRSPCAGHVAYPHLARNPIHLAAPALAELAAEHWDDGNAFFPPTSFQISNLNAGTGATNVIPGTLEAVFLPLLHRVDRRRLAATHRGDPRQARLDWSVDWALSGLPFLTEPGALLDGKAIRSVTGRETTPSTSGGTSDGASSPPWVPRWSSWDRSMRRFIRSTSTSSPATRSADRNLLPDPGEPARMLICPICRRRSARWKTAWPARPTTVSTARARAT